MNNFIFENSSKVYFGEGCVKEYLSNILSAYGDTVMLCYGGGSIKKNGIYDEVITVLKKENKAVVVNLCPFTIKLMYVTSDY